MTTATGASSSWISIACSLRLPPQRFGTDVEVLLPLHDVRSPPRNTPSADPHWLWESARGHPAVDRCDIEGRHLLNCMLVEELRLVSGRPRRYIGVCLLGGCVRSSYGSRVFRQPSLAASKAHGLEVFRLFDGGCLEHAERSSFRPLKSRPDCDFDVVAEPRQHTQQLVQRTRRQTSLE